MPQPTATATLEHRSPGRRALVDGKIDDEPARHLLDGAFGRALVHEERTPLDATNRRRFASARRQHVVMETHHHRCVDCGATEHLELDHDPPFETTGHTITTELSPRSTSCHPARHRRAS